MYYFENFCIVVEAVEKGFDVDRISYIAWKNVDVNHAV